MESSAGEACGKGGCLKKKYCFRSAHRSDLPAISQLVLGVCRERIFCELKPEGVAELERLYSPESLKERLDAGDRFLVAETIDGIAGAFAIREPAHIWLYFVAEPGRGLGQQLWQQVLADPSLLRGEHANTTDEITLNSSLGAVGFYERVGFRRTGPKAWSNGVVAVPMALRL